MNSFLFACSGGSGIVSNTRLGYVFAAVTGVLLLLSLALTVKFHRPRPTMLVFALFAIHPAWTVSAIKGDCGHLKGELSLAFTAIVCIAIGWQVARIAPDRRKQMQMDRNREAAWARTPDAD